MRPRDRLIAVAVLASLLPRGAHAGPGPLIDQVRQLLPPALFDRQEPIDPQPLPQDDPDAPLVTLSRVEDPLSLERQLRGLVRAPYANVRLRVANGQARLGNFSVGSGETFAGDLLVIRGAADLYGRVTGTVVTLDGDVVVHRGAVVDGDVLALGGRVRNLGGAVLGESRSVSGATAAAAAPRGALAATGLRVAGVAGVALTLGLLGAGLALFARPHLETVSDTAAHSVVRSFLAGLLGQVLVVPTFGMLVVGLVLTVVGVLLVPFVVAVYALIVAAGAVGGFVAVAHAMGETRARRRMAQGVPVSPNSLRYLLTGLGAVMSIWVVWSLFGWVPVAGPVMLGAALVSTWLVATVGLGAALLSRGGLQPRFAGRYVPTEMLTDEYLWATPQHGVPAVKRPPPR